MASKRAIRRRTMRRDQRQSCRDKVAHPNREAAAKQALERGRLIRQALQAYRCRHCPAWHVGHVPVQELKRWRVAS